VPEVLGQEALGQVVTGAEFLGHGALGLKFIGQENGNRQWLVLDPKNLWMSINHKY
jgi:hypothetical protein